MMMPRLLMLSVTRCAASHYATAMALPLRLLPLRYAGELLLLRCRRVADTFDTRRCRAMLPPPLREPLIAAITPLMMPYYAIISIITPRWMAAATLTFTPHERYDERHCYERRAIAIRLRHITRHAITMMPLRRASAGRHAADGYAGLRRAATAAADYAVTPCCHEVDGAAAEARRRRAASMRYSDISARCYAIAFIFIIDVSVASDTLLIALMSMLLRLVPLISPLLSIDYADTLRRLLDIDADAASATLITLR